MNYVVRFGAYKCSFHTARCALDFMRHIPFTTMRHSDGLTKSADDYCYADPGTVYTVYLPEGGTTEVDLGNVPREFSVAWYNPHAGGALHDGHGRRARSARLEIDRPPAVRC